MFASLSDRLGGVLQKVRGQGRITEDNVKDTLREVRMALLEADVHVGVVKALLEGVGFGWLPGHLAEADIVIASTASPVPVLGKGTVFEVDLPVERRQGERRDDHRDGKDAPAHRG